MYDVVVLGGGAGGVPAAIRSSQLGGRVAIVEAGELGGLCMNRGCIPLGHMMKVAQLVKDFDLGKLTGLDVANIRIDYPALVRRRDDLIGFMRQGLRATLQKKGIEIIRGRGRITGDGAVEVEGRRILYRKLILATGAKWRKSEFAGSDLDEVVNTEQLLTAQAMPKRVLVFGESPWLVEIAQFLARSGSLVTLATPQKHLLPEESKTIRTRLATVIRGDGVEIMTMAAIENAARGKEGFAVKLSAGGVHRELVVDNVVTLERVANLRGMGLGNLGLDEESPYLRVDQKTQTEARDVYAVGDVTAPPQEQFSHRAGRMGVVAAENAMGIDSSLDDGARVRVLFTHPQVASIGITPKEAHARGYDVIVGAAPLAMNSLGMIIGEEEGIIEIVAERSYGEILGVHMIGSCASEMIGQALLAITMEATLNELASLPFPHPTLSESLAEAARDALGRSLYLPL
jgi:dihydrolipoamide dehydrogenase